MCACAGEVWDWAALGEARWSLFSKVSGPLGKAVSSLEGWGMEAEPGQSSPVRRPSRGVPEASGQGSPCQRKGA